MITVTLPEWFAWLLVAWIALVGVESGINIYLKYLSHKLKNMQDQ